MVLDSGSTDRTVQLAKAAGARVKVRPMTDFAEQRNHADELAETDWVLHLDADERLTAALWTEMREAMESGAHSGYRLACLNIIFGAPLWHGGWYPQYHLRLYRRTAGRWGRDVHESVAISDGTVGTLREPIVHYSHPDIQAFVLKLDRYTTLEARQASGSRLTLALRALVEPVPYFVYKYVVQGGFRDGWRGLTIALLLAFYRCVSYLKALELRHQIAADQTDRVTPAGPQ
jgi:glycosyltransferase involved in cell wall biosynthesis